MVLGSAIRHLITVDKRNIFLAALFDKTVFVWSTVTGEKIAEFDTILDFGGKRLALGNLKDVFIAGAYTRYGVACYGLTDGNKIWHRNDLKGVQTIRISPDDKTVFCGFSDKAGHLIDLDSGTTIEKLRSVRDIYFDTYENWFVYDGLPDRNPEHYRMPYQAEVFDSKGHKRAIVPTCSLFDVAFSPNRIVTSGEGLNFISRQEPDKTIIYNPPADSYIQCITYYPNIDVYFGIQYNYRKLERCQLLKFDLPLDKPTIIAEVERSIYVFCDYGRHLISHKGQYINTTTGLVEKTFNFPQKEYEK
jgi:hypothetical protein